MRVLEDDVCAALDGVPDDALVQRMVPNRTGGHHHAGFSNRLRQFFEVPLLVCDDFGAGFFERWRVEQAIAAQVLVVVANQQFQFGSGSFGKPRGPVHCRLRFDCRIDDGQDLLDFTHGTYSR